jgi:tetrahydromethanopterin S-methyltransferase subunit B
MSLGGPPPYNDPLAGTPGASAPPPPPPSPYPGGPYAQYPAYGPAPADDEFRIHWPQNWPMRIGIVVIALLAAWMFIKQQIETGGALIGMLMTMLGLRGDARQVAITAAKSVAAASARQEAVSHQVAQVARDVKVTKEVVKDIQNNSSMPGTPGLGDRLDSGRPPPPGNL